MPEKRARSASRCEDKGSTTPKSLAFAPPAIRPPIRAVAMFPPPMNTVERVTSSGPRFLARAEDRRAETHLRRALRYRRLYVGRHAHRQRVQRQAGCAARIEARAQDTKLLALPNDVVGRLRDAHDAAQRQPRQPMHVLRQRQRVGGWNAAFGRFEAGVYLDQHIQGPTLR